MADRVKIMHASEEPSLTQVLFGDAPPRYWPYRHLVFPYFLSATWLYSVHVYNTLNLRWLSVVLLFCLIMVLIRELSRRWNLVDAELANMPPKPPRPKTNWKWWTRGDPDIPLNERVIAPIFGVVALAVLIPLFIVMIISEGGIGEIPIFLWPFFAAGFYFFLYLVTPTHAPMMLRWGARVGLFFMDFFKNLRSVLTVLAEAEGEQPSRDR